MLHKDSFLITPATFNLIQELQSFPELKDFFLVGGTSLTLQLGHRNSIDIDLFTQNSFEDDYIIDFIKSKYTFKEVFRRKNTVIGFINEIKVDFIRHDYPFVKPPITEEGITFLSKEDIAAMKLNAIVQSGKRLKDFIDIYFLLEHFSIADMLEFYSIKYPNSNQLIPLKALNYFDDIDENIDAPKLKKPLPMKKIKESLKK